jgi:nitrite reductase/ring-hydroxylating ferredoxin subunit
MLLTICVTLAILFGSFAIWSQTPDDKMFAMGKLKTAGGISCAIFTALVVSGVSAADVLTFPIAKIAADTTQGTECTYPFPSTDGVSIDRDNDVILVRSENRVYAFSLACPHENTALNWRPQDNRFQCPRHQAKYRPDGTWMSGHSTRNMDRFALRLEGQKVIVDASKLYRSDQPRAELESAVLVL